jgi:hypothetical protein
MFFQLLFIHLYRPFLKYSRATSPLPSHVSPRKYCTQAAGAISKLLRVYKRSYGPRQICNIAVYIAHSACSIHLLNLPDKHAKRDIIHGLKHLEEIGEMWTCARRTIRVLGVMASKCKIDLPEEVVALFSRTGAKWDGSGPPPSSSRADHPSQDLDYLGSLTSKPPFAFDQPASMAQATVSQAVPSYLSDSFLDSRIPAEQGPRGGNQASTPLPISGSRPLQLQSDQSMGDFNGAINRVRQSTELTKAQQDAWNAHQANRSQVPTSQHSSISTTTPTDPSVLFGGVASLVEEGQEWWLKDQSSLAIGFDNWNHPTTSAGSQDWSVFGYSMPSTSGPSDANINNSNNNSSSSNNRNNRNNRNNSNNNNNNNNDNDFTPGYGYSSQDFRPGFRITNNSSSSSVNDHHFQQLHSVNNNHDKSNNNRGRNSNDGPLAMHGAIG